jgi:hypothetical protein
MAIFAKKRIWGFLLIDADKRGIDADKQGIFTEF